MKEAVFVRSINTTEHGHVVVEASNGGPDGPPFVRFQIPRDWVDKCYVGKRYSVTVEEFN